MGWQGPDGPWGEDGTEGGRCGQALDAWCSTRQLQAQPLPTLALPCQPQAGMPRLLGPKHRQLRARHLLQCRSWPAVVDGGRQPACLPGLRPFCVHARERAALRERRRRAGVQHSLSCLLCLPACLPLSRTLPGPRTCMHAAGEPLLRGHRVWRLPLLAHVGGSSLEPSACRHDTAPDRTPVGRAIRLPCCTPGWWQHPWCSADA